MDKELSTIHLYNIINEMADGIVVQDRRGRIIYVNGKGRKLFGMRGKRSMIKASWHTLKDGLDFFDGQGRPLPFSEFPPNIALRGVDPPALTIGVRRKRRGQMTWLSVDANPIFKGKGKVDSVVTVFRDVTEQRIAEERAVFFATHDFLTGQPNRRYSSEHLERNVLSAGKTGRKLVVMFVDLDRLKNINDSLGHGTGDSVLRETAKRLKGMLGENDLVARWGGDEFIIILTHPSSVKSANAIAQGLLEKMNAPIKVDKLRVNSTISIGMAIFPDHGKSVGELLRNADVALYWSKKSGRKRATTYAGEMDVELERRRDLEAGLKIAAGRHEMRLRFQPIYDIQKDEVCSAETLLRWRHPRFGEISAAEFIPLAENAGIISDLGRWVLQNACEYLSDWHGQGFDLKLAVNVSGRQFTDVDLAKDILSAVQAANIHPRYLEIELTENTAVESIENAARALKHLDDKGITVVIDDFGTGYSSLNYLKRFPIRKLKIDGSFVRDCVANEQDADIIKAIIYMTKSLGIKAVAEGVDTKEQLAFLKDVGCQEVQGNIISPPLDKKEFVRWLKNQHPYI